MSPAGLFLVVVLLLSAPASTIAQAPPAAPSTPALPPPSAAPSMPTAPPPSAAPPTPAAPPPSAAPSMPAAPSAPGASSAAPAIEQGSTVKLEYTLKDDAGVVIDSNKGQAPLTFTQGSAQMIPGLERQIVGMHAGEEKRVVLKPEEAFGQSDPAAQTEVTKSMLPPESLTVGARLLARNAAGEQRPVTVKEIKDQTVVLDLNHPLAGRTLVFEIKVVGVE